MTVAILAASTAAPKRTAVLGGHARRECSTLPRVRAFLDGLQQELAAMTDGVPTET